MKATVFVRVSTDERSLAEALYSSLKPDNVDFPPGLSMKMSLKDRSLEVSLTSSITDTLISTVDDVFEACGTSLLGIHSVEG